MLVELPPPDLVISMYPDICAPRAARYCVGTIERPPRELRDSIVLLTSEVVSRAVRLHRPASRELIELRVWTGDGHTRVELRGAYDLICDASEPEGPQDDLTLMSLLADRWSIDRDECRACIWFEIDCHREHEITATRALGQQLGVGQRSGSLHLTGHLRRGACVSKRDGRGRPKRGTRTRQRPRPRR
jgi:hypothetical protein